MNDMESESNMQMITEVMIAAAPDGYVYVFGDNLEHFGLGGQAKVARPFVKCGKAYGIPTKRKPDNDESSFFADRDDEIYAVRRAFSEIRRMIAQGMTIVFFSNIGEGLADLEHRSPAIFGMIKAFIGTYGGSE